MKNIFLALLFSFSSTFATAQFAEKVRSARPGKTMGVWCVGKDVFQVQVGLDYRETRSQIDGNGTRTFNPVTVVRLGLHRNFEVNGAFGWQIQKERDISGDQVFTDISTTQVGFRVHLFDVKGIIPGAAVQYRAILPVGNENFSFQDIGHRINIAGQSKPVDHVVVGLYLGTTLYPTEEFSQVNYGLRFNFILSDKWGAFVENYGTVFRYLGLDTNSDAGVYYFVNKNLKLDFSAGWMGNQDFVDYFLNVGASWRLHKR